MKSSKAARLEGKVAIVTGSTDGIGFAIAQRLAREGAKVIISSRKQANVDRAVAALQAEGLPVVGMVCHVVKAKDRTRLLQEAVKLGGLDILVSNAAISPISGPFFDCDEPTWDKIFETNVKSAYLLVREALPLVRESTNGRIVFISSVAGLNPMDIIGPYSVSKTALLTITKLAAGQLACDGITVNCVAPGLVQTRFSAPMLADPVARENLLNDIPMKRFGLPNEIAGVVAFLVSDDASYITGETIVAAGGVASRL